MRLGGPVFVQTNDPVELAKAHRAQGYRAAYCPPMATLDDLPAVRKVEKAFKAEDVVIAEVGAWCNMIAPEPQTRQANLEFIRRQLALADEVGALCCVDFVGTFQPGSDFAPHPKNLTTECFELIVSTVRSILHDVNPKRTKFTLEMMPAVFPDDPDSYLRLVHTIGHPRFAVHLDPVNIINCPQRYFTSGHIIRECFTKLGPYVMSCHAKDVKLTSKFIVELVECPPGQGGLDYRTYLTELGRLPTEVPLMLEHLETPEQYQHARDHILGLARELGMTN